MDYTTEQKNTKRLIDYQNRLGYRIVTHLPRTGDCTNCYLTNSRICDKCALHGCELKTNTMSWENFKAKVDTNILLKTCTKIPESYIELCDLYDKYYDLPDLISFSGEESEESE